MRERRLKPWALLTILTGLNLLNYIDRYILSAVLTPIKNEMNLSDAELGRIATAFMFGYLATSPFFGLLGDRWPRKWLIAAGIFVWSLATFLTGFATGLGALILFRVFVGVGEASYATISPGVISDAFAPAKRNNALTIFYVAIPLGAALGFILGAQITQHYSWQHAFIWAGAPGLLLALILLPFREPPRGEAEGRSDEAAFKNKPTFRDVFRLFRIKKYCLLLAGYTTYTFAMGAFAYWGPTFLSRQHGLPQAYASTFFGAVLVITGLAGTLLGGFAATQWQKRNQSAYAWVLAGSSLLGVPLCYGGFAVEGAHLSMGLLAAAMFFLFLGTGPVSTLTLELVPVNLRSSGTALSIFIIHALGDMWSPEIVGRIADATGRLQNGMMLLPTALLVSGIFYAVLARRQRDVVKT